MASSRADNKDELPMQPKSAQMTPVLASFTDFPVEIKEQIYGLAIGRDRHFDIAPHSAQSPFHDPSSFLPAVCFTSKLERAIALTVLYATLPCASRTAVTLRD
jgi:hypothetical protein